VFRQTSLREEIKSAAKGLMRSALPLCGINAHIERPLGGKSWRPGN